MDSVHNTVTCLMSFFFLQIWLSESTWRFYGDIVIILLMWKNL